MSAAASLPSRGLDAAKRRKNFRQDDRIYRMNRREQSMGSCLETVVSAVREEEMRLTEALLQQHDVKGRGILDRITGFKG